MKEHRNHLLERMAHRGWSAEELDHAYKALEERRHDKHFTLNYVDGLLHWLLFLTAIIGNIAAAAVILPLLVLFPNPAIYGVLILLGGCFGLLIEVVVRHIDHRLGIHHHIVLSIIIPALAVISMVVVVQVGTSQLPNLFRVERHPIMIGVVYAVSFVLPHLMVKGIDWIHRR